MDDKEYYTKEEVEGLLESVMWFLEDYIDAKVQNNYTPSLYESLQRAIKINNQTY